MEIEKCPICFEEIGGATRKRKCPKCKKDIFTCRLQNDEIRYWCNEVEKKENEEMWEEHHEKNSFYNYLDLQTKIYAVNKFDRMLLEAKKDFLNENFNNGLEKIEKCKNYALEKDDKHNDNSARHFSDIYLSLSTIYGKEEKYKESLENFAFFCFWDIIDNLKNNLEMNFLFSDNFSENEIENFIKNFSPEFDRIFYPFVLDILKVIFKYGSLKIEDFIKLFENINIDEIEKANIILYRGLNDDEDTNIKITKNYIDLTKISSEIKEILETNFSDFN